MVVSSKVSRITGGCQSGGGRRLISDRTGERQGDNTYEESVWHSNGTVNLMYRFLREGDSDEQGRSGPCQGK